MINATSGDPLDLRHSCSGAGREGGHDVIDLQALVHFCFIVPVVWKYFAVSFGKVRIEDGRACADDTKYFCLIRTARCGVVLG